VDQHDPRYGLNPLRLYVNAFLAVAPFFLAGLAFINPRGAYEYNAGVCWLPIQPVWYRLALSWIPRYMIFITIIVLSFTVYFHVGKQFASFQQVWSSSRSDSHAHRWRHHRHVAFDSGSFNTAFTINRQNGIQNLPTVLPAESGDAPNIRHISITEFLPTSRTNHGQDRDLGIHEDFECMSRALIEPPEAITHSAGNSSNIPLTPLPAVEEPEGDNLDLAPSFHAGRDAPRTKSVPGRVRSAWKAVSGSVTTSDGRANPKAERNISENAANNMLEAKRQTIMLQIRMNFTYPIVYIALWIFPFILQCMQYKAEYAKTPPPGLSALSIMCISSMGFANSLIFLIREQPWTILGTFPDWACGWTCSLRCLRRSSSCSGGRSNDLWPNHDNTRLGIELGAVSRKSSDSTTIPIPTGYFSNIKWPSSWSRPIEEDPRKLKTLNFSAQTSARASARLRLAFERADRRAENAAEIIEDAPTSANQTPANIGRSGVGIAKNWWDHEYHDSPGLTNDNEDDFVYP